MTETAAAETRVAVSGRRPHIYHHLLLTQRRYLPPTRCGLFLTVTMTLADATEAGLVCCRHCEGGD